jgi:RHS repeat-associated protein
MYTSRRYDFETGLYHYRNRAYNASLGRFMQPDPIGTAGGINLYEYAGSDPINKSDPMGTIGVVLSVGVAGEGGLSSLFAQGGGQATYTLGFLFDRSTSAFSVVGFPSYGYTANAFNAGPGVRMASPDNVGTHELVTQGKISAIVGAFGGVGIGIAGTNANTASDLQGLSDTLAANVGFGPAQGTLQLAKSPEGTLVAGGAAPALNDLLGGQIPLIWASPVAVMPYVEHGKVRMLGVSTQQRDRMLPQVPTVSESGVPGFDTANWFGIAAPAGVPSEVVVRVGQAIREATELPDFQGRMSTLGFNLDFGNSDQFRELIVKDHQKYGAIIREAGIHPD